MFNKKIFFALVAGMALPCYGSQSYVTDFVQAISNACMNATNTINNLNTAEKAAQKTISELQSIETNAQYYAQNAENAKNQAEDASKAATAAQNQSNVTLGEIKNQKDAVKKQITNFNTSIEQHKEDIKNEAEAQKRSITSDVFRGFMTELLENFSSTINNGLNTSLTTLFNKWNLARKETELHQAELQNQAIQAKKALVYEKSLADQKNNLTLLSIEQAKLDIVNAQNVQQENNNKAQLKLATENNTSKERLWTSIFGGIGKNLTQIFDFMKKPRNVITLGGVTAGTIVGAYAGVKATGMAADGIRYLVSTPSVIKSTNYLPWFKRLFTELPEPVSLDEVILDPETKKQILDFADTIGQASKHGLNLKNAAFIGDPGTGKTLSAQAIVSHVNKYYQDQNIYYAIIDGAAVARLPKAEAVKQIKELLQFPKKVGIKLVVFIDEVEAIAPNRDGNLSEDKTDIVNTLIAETGASSDNICLILAGNYVERIDRALRSRLDDIIEFKLPGEMERVKLLELYLNKYLIHKLDGSPIVFEVSNEQLIQAARKIDKFSGRDIEKLVNDIGSQVIISGNRILNNDILEYCVNKAIRQLPLKHAIEKGISLTDATQMVSAAH